MNVKNLPMITLLVLAGTRLALAQGVHAPEPDGLELYYDAGLDVPEMPELVSIRVRHGESLYDIARWAGVTVEDIEALNGIDLHRGLTAGEVLELALTEDEQATFEKRRSRFAERRRDKYLKRRGGLVEVRDHRVRTGETLWGLARANGRIPMWLLASFNEGRDLDEVGIGDTVRIPVVGDVVARR